MDVTGTGAARRKKVSRPGGAWAAVVVGTVTPR
jgi:hypothetical protein